MTEVFECWFTCLTLSVWLSDLTPEPVLDHHEDSVSLLIILCTISEICLAYGKPDRRNVLRF